MLADKRCLACDGHLQRLSDSQINTCHEQLHAHWIVDKDAGSLVRRFVFKGFAKATYLANLCIWLADDQGHHPDVSFGWGYCTVLLTTHDVDGLTENDFIWAARLDRMLS